MVVLLSPDVLLTILQGAGEQALAIKSEATGILGESKVPPHHMETPWGLQAWFSTRVAQDYPPALLNTPIFTQHIFNPALPVAPGVSGNHLTNTSTIHQAGHQLAHPVPWNHRPFCISCLGMQQQLVQPRVLYVQEEKAEVRIRVEACLSQPG